MADHVFTGFGFGPIQSGLFVSEAYASGNFERIVIAEIDQQLVDAVRANNGRYAVNIRQNGLAADTPIKQALHHIWQDHTSPYENELTALIQKRKILAVCSKSFLKLFKKFVF